MLPKRPRMETARLVLKAYAETDEQAMIDLLTNPEVTATFIVPAYTERAQFAALFRAVRERSLDPGARYFEYGIYLDGRLIGFVNDCGIEEDGIEIGYVIHPDFWGRGYATEAVAAAIEELFRMGFHRIRAAYFEENLASRKVMEHCGMQPLDLESSCDYRGRTHRCLYCGIARE